jgi:hypothetical protein
LNENLNNSGALPEKLYRRREGTKMHKGAFYLAGFFVNLCLFVALCEKIFFPRRRREGTKMHKGTLFGRRFFFATKTRRHEDAQRGFLSGRTLCEPLSLCGFVVRRFFFRHEDAKARRCTKMKENHYVNDRDI